MIQYRASPKRAVKFVKAASVGANTVNWVPRNVKLLAANAAETLDSWTEPHVAVVLLTFMVQLGLGACKVEFVGCCSPLRLVPNAEVSSAYSMLTSTRGLVHSELSYRLRRGDAVAFDLPRVAIVYTNADANCNCNYRCQRNHSYHRGFVIHEIRRAAHCSTLAPAVEPR